MSILRKRAVILLTIREKKFILQMIGIKITLLSLEKMIKIKKYKLMMMY